jgi:hypothetical protein
MCSRMLRLGCPRKKKKKKNSVRTKTNRIKICFGCVSICSLKPKTNNFSLFWFVLVCFGVSNLYRNKQNCFESNRNNPKFSEQTKICSLSKCLVSLLFVLVQLKHHNSLFRYRSKTTETNFFETNQNKQTKTGKTLNFLPKEQNMLPIKLFWLVSC